ncbi:MAG: hypothetical protein U0236_01925 [Nitrospira sp.]
MQMMKRWLRRGLILPAAAVCALSVPVTAVQAALVNYTFSGNIDGLSQVLAPVSGSFQFETGTVGSGGVYNGTVKGFTLNIGGINHSSSFAEGANAIKISQNIPLGGGNGDRWALTTAVTGGDYLDSGYTPFSFDLRLNKIGGGLNLNVQDPPMLGSLNGGTARWRLFLEDADGNPAVALGSITSLTAVPLPTAVLLFGAGLISLVGLGAGGLRNLRTSKV